jgi:serine/threonine-protein kinase
MCDILQYLHSQTPPIVHQDFTPDNLLVSENGKLKLIDFMVAKQESVDTSTSTVVGKHHYMPPEQFRGKSTTQSDIYALGATLYFMLTGQDPEPMSQLHVSGSLDPIISRATALDTAQRYASAQEVKADLQQLLAVSPLT